MTAELVAAGVGGLALLVAMIRIVVLTGERGELRRDKALLQHALDGLRKVAAQKQASDADRIGRLTALCAAKETEIDALRKILRQSGSPGAAAASLDELLKGPKPGQT